jgi:hypothetical protein
MKTQEEIEQLAFKSYGDTLLKGSFIHGYTQCQEDMVEKKYTKEDMIKFAFDTYYYISGIMKVPFNQVSENRSHAEDNFKEYINSLNKQDNEN